MTKKRCRQSISLFETGTLSIDDIVRITESQPVIDLAIGSSNEEINPLIRQAAIDAMRGGNDHYADSRGIAPLREGIAEYIGTHRGISTDPETEIIATSGATEGLISSLSAIVGRGDEVITFEPYYQQYAAMVRLIGAKLRTVRLDGRDWELDVRSLASAFNHRTAALILNDPHNPTGKVFTNEELHVISGYCQQFNVVCIADEVYEHFTFDGRRHVSMIEVAGMRERTVVIGSLSKTYQVPGWRMGFVIAPAKLSSQILERHELFSGGACTPLQVAVVRALKLPGHFYQQLRRDYQRRRDYLDAVLSSLGFSHVTAAGGFYIFTQMGGIEAANSYDFAIRMIKEAGIACVPGGCFYSNPKDGNSQVRFSFAKPEATLEAASQALANWMARTTAPSRYRDFTSQVVKENTL